MADGGGVRGPPYPAAVALAGTARRRWAAFDGWCAYAGIDPLDLGWSRYLNLIYHWITKDCDREAVARIDAELVALSLPPAPPLAGLPRRPVWAIPPAGGEPDTAAFALAAAAALGAA